MPLSEADLAVYRHAGHLTVPGLFDAATTDAVVADIQAWGESFLAGLPAGQRAWYVDGRSLSDAEVYRDIAIELGLDATLVVAAYNDSATRAAAEAQFVEVGLLGVDSYPTLLVHTAHGTRRLGGPTSSAAALTRALDHHLAAEAS